MTVHIALNAAGGLALFLLAMPMMTAVERALPIAEAAACSTRSAPRAGWWSSSRRRTDC